MRCSCSSVLPASWQMLSMAPGMIDSGCCLHQLHDKPAPLLSHSCRVASCYMTQSGPGRHLRCAAYSAWRHNVTDVTNPKCLSRQAEYAAHPRHIDSFSATFHITQMYSLYTLVHSYHFLNLHAGSWTCRMPAFEMKMRCPMIPCTHHQTSPCRLAASQRLSTRCVLHKHINLVRYLLIRALITSYST